MLNISAASACQKVWQNRRKKSLTNKLVAFVVTLHLLGNAVFTSLMLFIANKNYPGGQAVMALQEFERDSTEPVFAHVDNLACQTGFTRFLEPLDGQWTLDKTEHLALHQKVQRNYSHLVLEVSGELKESDFFKKYTVLEVISAFDRLAVSFKSLPFFKIVEKKALYIMKKS